MEQINNLIAILKDLVHNLFYGKLVINFQNGKITNVEKTESIKV